MDKGLYVAMTGAQANLRAQAVVANNLANVDTTGFRAALAATEPFKIQGEGLKTRISALDASKGFNADGGNIMTSGNPLDLALSGENRWLAVQGPDGREAYTRAGDLKIDANGLLTNSRGNLVLGEDGAPLSVPPYQSIQIGSDGTVSMVPQGEGAGAVQNVGRLRVVDIDPKQLNRSDDGLFRQAAGAVEPALASGNVLVSGAIEGSNVNPTEQLVQMISLARQFEMNVRVIRAGDENAQASTSLLRSR